MPGLIYFTPTPSINGPATRTLTARATASSSTEPFDSSISGIFIFAWFGSIGAFFVFGILSVIAELLQVRFLSPWVNAIKLYNLTIGPCVQRKRTRQAASYDRARELRFLGRCRQEWADEEFALARKDGKKLYFSSAWLRYLEQGTAVPIRFRLNELPAEIRLQIYSQLDYGTALKLARVNRFFYFDRPANGIDREQRATYVYYAETFWQNRNRLACFSCLRVREEADFDESRRTGDFERFARSELERKCFDCRVAKGQMPWPRWKRFVRYLRRNIRVTRR